MEGQGESEGLERTQDNRDEKTVAVNKGMMIQEGGRKGDEGREQHDINGLPPIPNIYLVNVQGPTSLGHS